MTPGCKLCGRSAMPFSDYCCIDHYNLAMFVQKELGRLPMSLSEAEAIFNLTQTVRTGTASTKQLPLIPNSGR